MALEKLVQKQETTADDSAKEELERLRREKAEREAEAARQARDNEMNSRLSQLEQKLQEQYRNVRQGAAQPAPEPIYEAKQELGLTDEEILANPKESFEKLLNHRVSQALEQERAQNAQILGHQVKRGFESEIESLRKHPYFKDLEGPLYAHFQENPHEMIEAGSVRKKYNELVGENMETLTRLAAEREAKRKIDEEAQRLADQPAAVSRNRVVEPSFVPGTPPVSSQSGKKEEEKVLDADPARAAAKKELMDIYNQLGANLDEDEWMAIESGQVLPKKVAADIQLGKATPQGERIKPNVDY